MTKVTREQGQAVLAIFAEVLSRHLKRQIPTGSEAAYYGKGPELRMRWRGLYSSTAHPTILLEGGISDEFRGEFADYGIGNLTLVDAVQQIVNERKVGVWLETYASYAVSILPNEV
jgi:hypothetical protein